MKSNITSNITNRSLPTKLVMAGLCAGVLALTACQSVSEDSKSYVSTTTTTDDKAITDFGKEYIDSMQNMNQDMMKGMHANDADVAFAKGMLPHHQGAIDMARIQLRYGKDETMRKLATDIIAAQKAEIKQMQNWLDANPDSEEQAYTQQMQQAYADSMKSMHDDMMQGILSKDPDMAFAKGMLPHHQGAVAMAEVQLKYGKNEQMRQLAQNIIKAQKSEIDLMKNWIKQHS